MARKALSRPTDGEIDILRILWKHGASSVRGVRERLEEAKGEPTSSEALLTRLEIMARKGYVRRDDRSSPKRFIPVAKEAATQRHLVRDFVDRVFGGSVDALDVHLKDLRGGRRRKSAGK